MFIVLKLLVVIDIWYFGFQHSFSLLPFPPSLCGAGKGDSTPKREWQEAQVWPMGQWHLPSNSNRFRNARVTQIQTSLSH